MDAAALSSPLGKNNARGSAKMLVKFQSIDTICPSSPTAEAASSNLVQ